MKRTSKRDGLKPSSKIGSRISYLEKEMEIVQQKFDTLDYENKIILAEFSIISDWVKEQFGVQLINKESQIYKYLNNSEGLRIKDLSQSLSMPKQSTTVTITAAQPQDNVKVEPDMELETEDYSPNIFNVKKEVNGAAGEPAKNPPVLERMLDGMNGMEIKIISVESLSGLRQEPKPTHPGPSPFDSSNQTKKVKCETVIISNVNTKINNESVSKFSTRTRTPKVPQRYREDDSDEESKLTVIQVRTKPHTPVVQGIQNKTTKKRYACTLPDCNKSFLLQQHLTKHLKAHHNHNQVQLVPVNNKNQNLTCHYCHKTFSSSWSLKTHFRVHTGEKPFPCGYCGQRFAYNQSREIHERNLHTLDKPYKCNYCAQAYAQAGDLNNHLCRKHQKTYLENSEKANFRVNSRQEGQDFQDQEDEDISTHFLCY